MFAILIWMLCIIFQSMSVSDRFSSQIDEGGQINDPPLSSQTDSL